MSTFKNIRRTRHFLLLLIVLLLLFGGFLIWRETGNSDPVAYHLAKLEDSMLSLVPPKNAAEFFTWKRLRLNFSQVLSRKQLTYEDVEAHREALLKLGYFHRTNFTLLSTNLVPYVYPAVKAATLGDTNWSYSTEGTNITVTAATADLPQWHRIFSNLNRLPLASDPP